MNTTGTLPYGMTQQKQSELFAVSQDVALTSKAHFTQFYDTTFRAVVHAVDLTKASCKDAARNWHRYFTQAGVLTVLTESSCISESKLTDLKLALLQLRDACHPEAQISLETDIQHIRHMLEKLLEKSEQNESPQFKFSQRMNFAN